MTVRVRFGVALAACIILVPTWLSAAETKLRGIAIDRPLDAEPLPADLPRTVPLIIRLSITPTVYSGQTADRTLGRLREVVGLYRSRGMEVILSLGSFPEDNAEDDGWRRFVRSIVEQNRTAIAAYQLGQVRVGDMPDVTRYGYLLKLTAVQIRSVDPEALLIQGTVPAALSDWEERVLRGGASPYVDGLAIDGPTSDDELFRPAVAQMADMFRREKSSATVVLGPFRLPRDGEASTFLIETVLRSLGTSLQISAFDLEDPQLKPALAAAGRLSDLLSSDLVSLDEEVAGLRIMRGTSTVTSSVPHRLLYSLNGFDTFLVYWGSSDGEPLDVEITMAGGTAPTVRDPVTGTSEAPIRLETLAAPDRLRMRLPSAAHPRVVDFNHGAGGTYGDVVEVQKDVALRVEEIVFRYQQAQAAQDAALQSYVAHARIEQHFHPSAADAAYNIVTENRLFWDHEGLEWEELSFEMNGAKWTAHRPAFPLVQPEKVLSLPLDLRLNQDYRYRLDGVDVVNGRAAFVVRFDPVDSGRALYRGTVWVDRRTFVRLKIQAVQTRLSGPVVSNDEIQLFESAGELHGRPVWLLSRLISKQTFLIAGRNVLVEREVHLSDFVLNGSDFASTRSTARASNRIMYRDTDAGVRYFVKKGDTRVVSDQMTTSAKAIAMGADFDPSFDFPLPIGGINILDFNFLNRNLQLALLYGGVIALGNIQHANLWGGKFDASVDFFGLAVKSNDDVFDSQGKQSGERVNRLPFSTGLNLGYQWTAFQKFSAHYEFRYDAYFRDASTAPDFVTPSSTGTNGEGLGYEFRRHGYSMTADVAAYQRTTWNPWGFGDDFDPSDRTYTKYNAGVSKDFIVATFHTIHLNGAYFGGQRLDRFSMYQFGMFDPTRIHGVPSAVRFAQLGMGRVSYSFNLFEQYRLDLSVDHASGWDPNNGSRWQQVTGTGIRGSLKAPFNTILQVDYGKSFLPESYRGAGSTVVQVLLLKPL